MPAQLLTSEIMSKQRIRTIAITSLFILGSILLWNSRSHSFVKNCTLECWEQKLNEQASALSYRSMLNNAGDSQALLPQIILKNNAPGFWTHAIPDSSLLSSPRSISLVCPNGSKWVSIPGRLNDSLSWLGFIPVQRIISSATYDTENTHQHGAILFVNDCKLDFPESKNNRSTVLGVWMILAFLLLLPVLFSFKINTQNFRSFFMILLALSGYFVLLNFGFSQFMPNLLDFSQEWPGNPGFLTRATYLMRAMFMLYLGILVFKTNLWSTFHEEGKSCPPYLVIALYLLILTGILTGTQLLAGVTHDEWLDIHFLLNGPVTEATIVGIATWLLTLTAVILIGLRATRTIHNCKLSIHKKLKAMAAALVISALFTFLPSVEMSVASLLLTGFSALLFLDIFIEEEKPSLSWIMAAFLLIAALTTAVAYQQIISSEKKWAHQQLHTWSAKNVVTPDSLRLELTEWSSNDRRLYNIFHKNADTDNWFPVNLENPHIQSPKYYTESFFQSKKIFWDSALPDYMIARPKLELLHPLSLFAKTFAFLILLFAIITAINYKWPFLPARFGLALFAQHSLRTRIQIGILATILSSFIIIGAITQYYYALNSRNVEKSAMERQINRISEIVFQLQDTPNSPLSPIELSALKNAYDVDIQGYHQSMAVEKYITAPFHVISQWKNGLPFVNRIRTDDGTTVFIADNEKFLLSIFFPNSANLTAYSHNLMSTLISVYVFLFLFAGSIGLAIANSITWPIEILAEKIRRVRLGQQNEPLDWKNPDELGDLIQVYNEMIEKLDQSAKSMVKLERDMAWREMAQQVAHEIKNPLTPMKLSIQYLQQAVGGDPERLKQLIPRVSETLLEQVDNLASIAGEFSNFGTLPKANNEKVNLNEVVASVHDLFRKREDINIHLYVPIDDLWIFADRNYLIRILNNLIKNAIQAIPGDREGVIEISLKKHNDLAQIKVKDNGVGIPDDMREKVFQPNFTTKSSGTGLGLAICASLLESFNGTIYFETTMGSGTDFFVELPLMHLENNFQHIPRVKLDEDSDT